eukprot:jgi/Bigna1/52081/estExt_Genewise1Plus.C_50118
MAAKRQSRFGKKALAQSKAETWNSLFIDRSSVKQIRTMCRALSEEKLPLKHYKKTVAHSIHALTEGSISPEVAEALALSTPAKNAFLGNVLILRTAVRQNIEEKVFGNDVGKMMPEPFANVLTAAYRNRRAVLQSVMKNESKALALPTLDAMKWRVDVTISTTSLSRVFRPTVILRLTLSDGKVRTFEVNADKFNELRYNVAKLLKLTLDLENHPMLIRDL